MTLEVKILNDEYWWGVSSAESRHQPFCAESEYFYDMYMGYNQTMPLLLSIAGRYIWCEKPMRVRFSGGVIYLEAEAEILLKKAGNTLRDAYLAASKSHFPFSGRLPETKFFETAQYNTWMEMDYNQTQEGVLRYAHGLIDNGYEPGVLMIDEGWHTRYGLWEFDKHKFPDPKAMIDELHELGFTVMLWIVPLVTSDGRDFILATEEDRMQLSGGGGTKKYFLRTDEGKVALVKWWNGYSAILNMCKEEDREFLDTRLQRLIKEYGVDGFKFDGGNISMYNPKNVINGTQTGYSADELNIAWNEFGARYAFHEYKDTFKGGGKPVIQRLQDRNHKWIDHGLATVIPAALVQGLLGHPFICPDMVGGGEWSFNYTPGFVCDMELFVRMAECSALFPMMQFSWAPWRMLDQKHASLCLNATKIRKSFTDYIMRCVRSAAINGEPILRNMEYTYPHRGFEKITDQFLVGKELLVAPVIEQGALTRRVVLPEGRWYYLGKEIYEGGKAVTVAAPLGVLPYFTKYR